MYPNYIIYVITIIFRNLQGCPEQAGFLGFKPWGSLLHG